MSQPRQKKRDWKEMASDYAEDYGWKMLCLHPKRFQAPDQEASPSIKQLGRRPLVELPDGATNCPEEIMEWGPAPGAVLGVLTGPASGITALEVPHEEEAITQGQRRSLKSQLPGTRTLAGRNREYLLFLYPEGCGSFKGIRRVNGLVLHGEGSVIPVPGPPSRRRRRYSWMIDEPDEIASFPDMLRSLFGVDKDLETILSGEEAPTNGQNFLVPNGRPPACGGKKEAGLDSSLPFRSGKALREKGPGPCLPYSWLSRGALSLLAGPPKTGGKSTFVVNLATHIATGRRFLGHSSEPRPVVLLSDLPATRLRTLLSEIGVTKEGLSRLHVLHPRDVVETHWRSLLDKTFGYASQIEAGLVIVDSLDQFVEAKSGLDATTSDEVTFALTAESPADCATLAVVSSSVEPAEPMRTTIENLGLLGAGADLVARMDAPPSGSAHPTLRRIQFRSRLDDVPSHLLCEMIRGRYQLFQPNSMRGARSYTAAGSAEGEARMSHDQTAPEVIGDGHTGDADKTPKVGVSERQTRLGLPSNEHLSGTET